MAGQFVLPLLTKSVDVPGSFVVTASNRDLVDRLMDWQHWPYQAAILVGPEASGKTTLGQVFAHQSGGIFLDDADVTARSDSEALFHAWNRAQAERVPVLFAAVSSPNDWGITLPDLLSRLNASQILVIAPPDAEMAALLLQKRLGAAGIALPDSLAQFAALRLERSYGAIAELSARLDLMAMEQQRPIGQKMIREALCELFGSDNGSDNA